MWPFLASFHASAGHSHWFSFDVCSLFTSKAGKRGDIEIGQRPGLRGILQCFKTACPCSGEFYYCSHWACELQREVVQLVQHLERFCEQVIEHLLLPGSDFRTCVSERGRLSPFRRSCFQSVISPSSPLGTAPLPWPPFPF